MGQLQMNLGQATIDLTMDVSQPARTMGAELRSSWTNSRSAVINFNPNNSFNG